MSALPESRPSYEPSFAELLQTFAMIGCLSFGGPAGQIALMHRIIVDEKKWLGEERFLHALNFCMLLPGPEAMQLATYAGWSLHGWRGGLGSGLLFVLPGAIVILVLSMLYAAFGQVPIVSALFFGIKAAVLVIVIEALMRVARRALKLPSDWWIAAAAFLALYVFDAPFPVVIALAGLIGCFRASAGVAESSTAPIEWRGTLATVSLWLAIWLVPVALLILAFGPEHVFAAIALFFSKLAIVTFGGAYAVLTYMAQEAVVVYGWLNPREMVDGLGLAETTPGPLILVTEFVGYLAGHRLAGGMWGGVAGAMITLWVTFTPCFLWIFAAAPYVERLAGLPRVAGALAAITAAVVGVILNLSVWFAIHVLFAKVSRVAIGPATPWIPDFSTLDPWSLLLSLLAALALLRFHLGIVPTLGLAAAAGLAIKSLI